VNSYRDPRRPTDGGAELPGDRRGARHRRSRPESDRLDRQIALARRHRDWIAAGWGGRVPSADELTGLAEMYVEDERFAANYGGVEGAGYVRDALTQLAITELG
jgi:hypothetical protein